MDSDTNICLKATDNRQEMIDFLLSHPSFSPDVLQKLYRIGEEGGHFFELEGDNILKDDELIKWGLRIIQLDIIAESGKKMRVYFRIGCLYVECLRCPYGPNYPRDVPCGLKKFNREDLKKMAVALMLLYLMGYDYFITKELKKI